MNMFFVKNIKSVISHMKKVKGRMNQNFHNGPERSVITEKMMKSQNREYCE